MVAVVAVVIAVQEIIITVVVAVIPVAAAVYLATATTVVSGSSFYCYSAITAITMDVDVVPDVVMVFSAEMVTDAVNGLFGSSFSPASAAVAMASAKKNCGRYKSRPFYMFLWNT